MKFQILTVLVVAAGIFELAPLAQAFNVDDVVRQVERRPVGHRAPHVLHRVALLREPQAVARARHEAGEMEGAIGGGGHAGRGGSHRPRMGAGLRKHPPDDVRGAVESVG